jgi:hypothetical protein
MLVTIAAAAVAVALAPAERPAPKTSAAPKTFVVAAAKPVTVCKGEGRMIRAGHEPAIYRPGADEGPKRLIDMPMAEACRLGGAR